MKIGDLVLVVLPDGREFYLIYDEEISGNRLSNEGGTIGERGFCGLIECGQ